jgi:ATP-dependent DNA helicase RecG
MHRLLQGDVGSGKTVVAFMACLPALNSGFQVAWLAPTEVLAYQTWMQIASWLEPLGFEAALVTGATQGRDRQTILADLKANRLRVVVGTHALLETAVSFAKLGMVVIDEQHRFGVEQRVAMQDRDPAADFLLLSATPIPQTLAQTLYGDLDVVSITELPAGRLEVGTHLVPNARRADMEQFVLKEIQENKAQIYYVVPRIESDDDDENTGLKDIGTIFSHLTSKRFSKVPSAMVHGRLSGGEKEKIVRDFSSGAIKLLVATTVIEVGIDAPGATIIVIENAERFGLSQLHQLRGRVGRSTRKSYCFLLHEPTADGEAEIRLKAFCKEHDGFTIAEMDLQMRGPGQMAGAGQAGWDDPRMQMVLDNVDLFREVQKEIGEILDRKTKP